MMMLTSIQIKFTSSFTSKQSSSPSTGTAVKRVFIGTPAQKNRRLISDCMTPIDKLVTLTQSSTVNDAVDLLLKLGLSGAPVIHDKTGDLVGIVSSFDFLQQEAGDGTILPPIEGNSDKDVVESYLSAAKKICATKVGDLMTTNIRTMESTENMKDAASLMAQEKLHRLPIVDNDGKLVGMLTSSDVMIDMVHVLKNLPPARGTSTEESPTTTTNSDHLNDSNNGSSRLSP